ncbi:cell wall protein DAN4-like [Pecten maximus]|uniref:cell wall protein DAN4-like n=1 Tax=Pecten maximus TaxID=6579 RepID=UPI001458A469|nr:cell wall protein DAN4-like [Pecten maximus]
MEPPLEACIKETNLKGDDNNKTTTEKVQTSSEMTSTTWKRIWPSVTEQRISPFTNTFPTKANEATRAPPTFKERLTNMEKVYTSKASITMKTNKVTTPTYTPTTPTDTSPTPTSTGTQTTPNDVPTMSTDEITTPTDTPTTPSESPTNELSNSSSTPNPSDWNASSIETSHVNSITTTVDNLPVDDQTTPTHMTTPTDKAMFY